MTGRREFLSELKDTVPMPAYLKNGTRTDATMVGQVPLSPEMELLDDLYVPSLTCNLISIRQLITVLNCHITFTNLFCVIRDHTLKMLIGTSELWGGEGGVCCFRSLQSHTIMKAEQAEPFLV